MKGCIMNSENEVSRRTFVATGVGTAIGVAASTHAQAQGANDRIRLGFIGVGNRGRQVMNAFFRHKDCVITAICDVYKTHNTMTLELLAKNGMTDVAVYDDHRKLLEDNNVDAVVIATPDHWHAIQTIDACNAGKDVYVEKPVSATIHEGRQMVKTARRTKRIVQVGTHRRSSVVYKRLAEHVQKGVIGDVTVSRAYHLSNMAPKGIGKLQPSDPPADLDWDMWLGPRAMRPYQGNICPYKFRWWKDFSSQIANNGIHYLDAIRWVTGEEYPTSIVALGGNFAVDDDRTIPDTLEATFQFASGRILTFGHYEATGQAMMRKGEVEIRGTKGMASVSGTNFEIFPEKGGQFQDPTPRMEGMKDTGDGSNGDLTASHARNFLDCIKTRETPRADIEVGHRSTSLSNLANISLYFGERLEWDGENEVITNHKKANELLHYEYRKPWKLG